MPNYNAIGAHAPAVDAPHSAISTKNPKLTAALALANYGFTIFPLVPNDKRPLIDNWRNLASNDTDQVRRWWSGSPEANIGIATDNLLVIDVDPRNGGIQTFRTLFEEQHLVGDNFPPTIAAATQSGGTHMFYWLPANVQVRGGAHKLGLGVDVKSYGGYVVAAGSTIDGREYQWKNGYEPDKRDFAQAPPWLISRCKAAKPKSAEAGKIVVEENDAAVEQARKYLDHNAPEAIQGGRDNTAFVVAARLYDFGVSLDTARELLADWNEVHCHPSLEPYEIERIVQSARVNRENAIGAKHPDAPGFEAVEIAPRKTTPIVSPVESAADDVAPVSFQSLLTRAVPPVEELIPGLLEKGTVTFLSAPGGKHKSRLAVQLGLCIDAGAPVFGRQVEQATFVYVSYEDHADEVTRRAQAISRRLQLTSIMSGRYWDRVNKDSPLAVVHESGECELKPFWTKLRDYLLSIEGHKFVVLDGTYNALRFAGQAKINETSVMSGIGLLQRLCGDTNSTMLTLWHPSQSGQERGDASGWSVAWHNAPRARLSLKSVADNEDAFELTVEKRNHGPKGKPIVLYWSDGTLLPRTDVGVADQEDRLRRSVVRVAIKAAEKGVPIQKQKHPEKWAIDEIELETGRRPSRHEVKDILAREAVLQDSLRFIPGSKGTAAGYYPVDAALAGELARDAKRQRRTARKVGADA